MVRQIMQVPDAEQALELVENIVPGKGEVNASPPGLGSQSLLWVLLGLPLVVLRRRAERHKRAFLKPTVSLLVGVLVMFAPLVSQAFESEESYVGLGLGFSRLTPGTSDSVYDNVDESGFGFQLFGGYRLKYDISVELHYTTSATRFLKMVIQEKSRTSVTVPGRCTTPVSLANQLERKIP